MTTAHDDHKQLKCMANAPTIPCDMMFERNMLCYHAQSCNYSVFLVRTLYVVHMSGWKRGIGARGKRWCTLYGVCFMRKSKSFRRNRDAAARRHVPLRFRYGNVLFVLRLYVWREHGLLGTRVARLCGVALSVGWRWGRHRATSFHASRARE